MRTAALALLAAAALATAAFGAERALRAAPVDQPGLTADAGGPLFVLEGLRHGDRAERCVTVTNEGGDEAGVTVLGEREGGDLAEHLRLLVTRGCGEGVVLFSGPMSDFASAADADALAPGERRRFGLAVEVGGTDAQVQGRRAVETFAFGAAAAPAAGDAEGRGGEGPAAPADGAPAAATADSRACRTISFAPQGRRRHPVLIKRHRVSRRVTAKLILRIYGAPGQQRLVLVTGLRVGRRVLAGRRFGRVSYRVGQGASITSRRRPFRVRIAPGALRPGRNVVRVTVVPREGRPVRARYVLTIAAAGGGATECEIG